MKITNVLFLNNRKLIYLNTLNVIFGKINKKYDMCHACIMCRYLLSVIASHATPYIRSKVIPLVYKSSWWYEIGSLHIFDRQSPQGRFNCSNVDEVSRDVNVGGTHGRGVSHSVGHWSLASEALKLAGSRAGYLLPRPPRWVSSPHALTLVT